MKNSLQKQLTRTHFLVTLTSLLLLVLLVLGSYYVYLKTPYPARWAGLTASDYATDLADLSDYWQEPLNEALAQEFLLEITDGAIFEDVVDDAQEQLTNADVTTVDDGMLGWLILTPDGRILASDHPAAYPVGQNVRTLPLPVFHADWLIVSNTAVDSDTLIRFGQQESLYEGQPETFHVGFAPILNRENEVLGWIYFRAYDRPTAELLTQAARQLGAVLLGATLIAMLVAGLIGRQVAQRFAQRLQRVTTASAALAAGELAMRAPVDGNDEIAQLGGQFNHMADQLTTQMRKLHQLADDNAQLAHEARSLAILEERNRLARDLHDAIKQKLFGLNLTAGALKPMLTKDPSRAAQGLDQLSQMTSEILEEMDQINQRIEPYCVGESRANSRTERIDCALADPNQHPRRLYPSRRARTAVEHRICLLPRGSRGTDQCAQTCPRAAGRDRFALRIR